MLNDLQENFNLLTKITYTKLQYHNPHTQMLGIHEDMASLTLPQFQHMICGLKRKQVFIISLQCSSLTFLPS